MECLGNEGNHMNYRETDRRLPATSPAPLALDFLQTLFGTTHCLLKFLYLVSHLIF